MAWINPFIKGWRDSVDPNDPVHYPDYGKQWWLRQFASGVIDSLQVPTVIHNPETPDVSRRIEAKVSVKAWGEITLVTSEIPGERYQTRYNYGTLHDLFFGFTIDRELDDSGVDYLGRFSPPSAYTPDTTQQWKFSFDLPLLSVGMHQVYLYFSPVFQYASTFMKCIKPWPSPWWSCWDESAGMPIYIWDIWTFVPFSVDVRDPLPHANFNANVVGQYTPVTAYFGDDSVVDPHYPIRTRWWNFGDPDSGQNTSTAENPAHVYERPGAYIVSLTVSNQYGEDRKTATVPVLALPPHPVFHADCWFPNKVDNPHEKFTPYMVIENQGGEGYIYMYYLVEGRRYDLVTSIRILGYDRYQVAMPADKDISYWLHRSVEPMSELVSFDFYVGTVGQDPSDVFSVEVGILHGEQPSTNLALVGAAGLIAAGAIILVRSKK